ncbi:hypothetical protein CWD94_08380 [Lysinibacillus xylanilyticus]|uniref:Uncharacterized protein n=1 Tax=Lysinibacillus xylanilyticus TaxID=582475 RepID=A0A2M9Q7Y6_9BACI|nr:hypothetical protein CWD94_08380 [Lysinibacillus xylanilyticus]
MFYLHSADLFCAKAKRQQQMFLVAKAKRQQQMFLVAKAKRQLQETPISIGGKINMVIIPFLWVSKHLLK